MNALLGQWAAERCSVWACAWQRGAAGLKQVQAYAASVSCSCSRRILTWLCDRLHLADLTSRMGGRMGALALALAGWAAMCV